MDFNAFAGDYRTIHNANLNGTGYSSSYFAERKVSEIVAHYSHVAGERLRILDLGCGDGQCAYYFRKYFPHARIYGLDVSEASISVARNRNIADAEFSVYDGQNIPLEAGSFDIIMVANTLHHIPEDDRRERLLQGCYRVLAAAGLLFVFEHNPYNPVTRKIVNDCVFDKDARLIGPGDLKKLLRGVGFAPVLRFIIFFPGFVKRKEALERMLWWLPLGGQYYFINKKIVREPERE